MSSESIIRLDNISKCYLLYDKPQDRLKQMIVRSRKKYYTEFWALHGISFEIKKGACIGILGRNGAGKSTLLQIITGIIPPTSGHLEVKGKIAAMLELGTGFNPEFTGRENVFLNGSILGLTQDEIHKRFDDIAAFADIGNFIEQPVKTYSSGMMIRLAFAVAVHVDPEILVIDEALSVGDAKFQAKCFRKFQEFREKEKTILFVTHATEQVVRHCDDVILLEGGKIYERGEPKATANTYLSLLFNTSPVERQTERLESSTNTGKESDAKQHLDELDLFVAREQAGDNVPACAGYNAGEYRWGSGAAEIVDILLGNDALWSINHFSSKDQISFYLKVRFHRDVAFPIYGLTVSTPDGVTVYGTNSRDWDGRQAFASQSAGDVVVVGFTFAARLAGGHYLVSLGVAEQLADDVSPLDRRYDCLEIYITNDNRCYGLADLEMNFETISSGNGSGSTELMAAKVGG